MVRRNTQRWLVLFGMVFVAPAVACADTFFFTGPSESDFFDESNWTTMADGTGASPAAGAIDPAVGIVHSLIIDGDTVLADGGNLNEGGVDFASGGGFQMLTGSSLDVFNDSFNARFEISTGASFSFDDALLSVQDDIFLRGTLNFTDGAVESTFDDIEFLSSDLQISGTAFNATDVSSGSSSNIIIRAELTPAAGSSITGATFITNSRLGIREFDMVATDSSFTLSGDIEDVFVNDEDTATASLTLKGNSTIIADQVQEGSRLILDDSSTATFTNTPGIDPAENSWFTESSTVTLNSPNAQLILQNPQIDPGDAKVINGVTGFSYAADSSTWDNTTWNGTDAVTLSITSMPSDPDFDGDNDVDGQDFLIWQRGFGSTGQLNNSSGDANGDGIVNGLDLASWQAQFGSVASLAALTINVPEPASWLLLVGGTLFCRIRIVRDVV